MSEVNQGMQDGSNRSNEQDQNVDVAPEIHDVKMDGESLDITEMNKEALKQLFPEIVSDGKIDFEKLKLLLGEDVETSNERYNFTWYGKTEAIHFSQVPSMGTLRPCVNDSVNWDTTKNLYIEGDNLEVLKLLNKSYRRKIKLIYIDPPYNTGNDFIYPDDYKDPLNNYFRLTSQVDNEGNKLSTNLESDGRYHTKWLSMMYPRLKIARDLLSDDGVIFISIDDKELFNLKKICDEIFGENNFVNNISIKMSELSGVKMKHLNKYSKLKESLLIYSKNSDECKLNIEKRRKSADTLNSYLRYYTNIIVNPSDDCSNWIIQPLSDYFIDNKITIKESDINQWKIDNSSRIVYRTNSRSVDKYIESNPNSPSICSFINADGEQVIKWDNKEMLFLSKYVDEYVGDIWMDISTINLNKETESVVFENGQKPLSLMSRIIRSVDTKDSIILDFFSGSSTMAHAIINENAKDGYNRHFIMVQLPLELDTEYLSSTTDNKKVIQKTIEFLDSINKPHIITEIGKERIRRAIFTHQVPQKTLDATESIIDLGFKVFKMDSSNIAVWNPESNLKNSLIRFENNIKVDDSRTDLDIVYEILLKKGLDLNSSIDPIDGSKFYSIASGALMVCLEDVHDTSVAERMVELYKELQPLVWSVVFKDNGFSSDDVKANTRETLRMAGLQDSMFETL